jgi:hypothetical protein
MTISRAMPLSGARAGFPSREAHASSVTGVALLEVQKEMPGGTRGTGVTRGFSDSAFVGACATIVAPPPATGMG